jgi:hypothetical protein
MHRARASVPPEAIRIEDEVWQEAFRETPRPRDRARLRSLDGGGVATRPPPSRRISGPRRRTGRAAPSAAAAPSATATPSATAARPASTRPVHAPQLSAAVTPAAPLAPEAPIRRTVTITGRGAERNLPWPTDSSRRRSARRPHERAGFKPDRVAMWAVLLGVLLVLVAVASAHA